MRRIITISYTQLDAGGGVPAFNRALHSAFPDRECKHICWDDLKGNDLWPAEFWHAPEWEKARILNWWTVKQRWITTDDVVVADGFWAKGLESFPFAISHSHGIWGHVTKDDIDAGRQPENELLHNAQVTFRRRWIELKKPITAVSDFIAEQMRLQWGFEVDRVINNGVDTEVFRPTDRVSDLNDLLIIHGVNDRGNVNKGWDHIKLLKERIPSAHILSLDEAHVLLNQRGSWTKPEVLAQADLVVHPSGFEGNSMFVAEALACGLPVIGYNVGFLWFVGRIPYGMPVGYTLPRDRRSPSYTAANVQAFVRETDVGYMGRNARLVAERYLSTEIFRKSWREYVEEVEARGA